MVNISQETPSQIDARLKQVIKDATLKLYQGSYAFEEFSLSEFSMRASKDALALVRDERLWSQLLPCDDSNEELFALFSFHFEKAHDNSGFVGWLASYLKAELGTGVFVTCGQNSDRGGIFDYWGVPYGLKEKAFDAVQRLMGKS